MVPNESPTAALSHGKKQSFVQVIITSVGKRRRGCSGNPPVGSTLYWKRRINAPWVVPCRSQSPVWCVVYQSGVCGSPKVKESLRKVVYDDWSTVSVATTYCSHAISRTASYWAGHI